MECAALPLAERRGGAFPQVRAARPQLVAARTWEPVMNADTEWEFGSGVRDVLLAVISVLGVSFWLQPQGRVVKIPGCAFRRGGSPARSPFTTC